MLILLESSSWDELHSLEIVRVYTRLRQMEVDHHGIADPPIRGR